MPNFRYRALDGKGTLVDGAMAAASPAEVSRYVESIGLVLIESSALAERASLGLSGLFNRPTAADVSTFTRDLALILGAKARINDALELLAADLDLGRIRPVVLDLRQRVLAGLSFGDALAPHVALFTPTYIALVRVGEAAGALDRVLVVLADERARSEALRRRVADALRYPLFILLAAIGVLTFFLTFVLPQFASVLQDLGARVDPVVGGFLFVSAVLRAHGEMIAVLAAALVAGLWWFGRRPATRARFFAIAAQLPLATAITASYRTALFCRNLSLLLGSGVHLAGTLRILTDIMSSTGDAEVWQQTTEKVRHGAKLADALADTAALPATAIRMLRIGDESGQLPLLAARVAELYESKLQRSLDRIVGIAGPVAIVAISIVVGGLIVSVMTALMSITQMVN